MLSKIEISHRTILFTVALLASIWFVIEIRDILLLLFVAFIIMSALRPTVDWFASRRVPRVVSILVIYGIVFGFVGFGVAGMVPSLIVQSTKLAESLPSFIARVIPAWNIDWSSFGQQLAPIGENLVKVTMGIFSNFMAVMTVMVFAFYFLLEHSRMDSLLSGFMGDEAASTVMDVERRIEKRLGSWVVGEMMLMVFIGLCSYVGLTILRVDYALPLAIIAGVLEIVPTIGPIVSGIPAVLVALSMSPLVAMSVAALYFIIQQIENTLVVPFVMKKSVGMSPIITIFSLMVGARLAGVAGAVLSVPTVLIIQELIPVITNRKRQE